MPDQPAPNLEEASRRVAFLREQADHVENDGPPFGWVSSVFREDAEIIDALLSEREAREERERFVLDGIAEVVIDPAYEWPGGVEYQFDGTAFIKLREYDERVLLHECIHAIMAKEGEARSTLGPDGEERLVRHLTRALYAVGWRLRKTDRTIAQVEHELNETARQRDELAGQLDGGGTRDFDYALPATESAQAEGE